MTALNWEILEAASLRRDPYDHILVEDVLKPDATAKITAEFPTVAGPGSFALKDAPPGPVLQGVIDELQSGRFRDLMSDLFGLDLSHCATMVTLRGECGLRDGFVHTDSKSKILSLLLYLNEDWSNPDGRLRLLGDDRNLAAPVVEVPPRMGTLLVFRRTDNSWHGHTPYVGPRRVLQFNYVRSKTTDRVSDMRHRLSALWKRRRTSATEPV